MCVPNSVGGKVSEKMQTFIFSKTEISFFFSSLSQETLKQLEI